MPTQLAPARELAPPGRERLPTPRLYWLVAAGLVVLALVTGVAAVADVRERSALLTDVAEVKAPISVDAQTLYRSLAEADAIAATAFLSTTGESATLRTRYLDGIARASTALTVALRDADDDETARLRVVAEQLPVYTGLVETARSNQRHGVPLGGAYLREASGLMQQTILPAAAGVFDSTHRRLVGEQEEADGFPWLAAFFGALLAAALLWAQVLVARRSRRTFNLGLVAASGVTVLALLWSVVALGASTGRLETGPGSPAKQVLVLANAGRAALQARANESLTLVARGGGATFETEFVSQLDELIGVDGQGGLLAAALAETEADSRVAVFIDQARTEANQWRKLHQGVRAADNGGDWNRAVELATATGEQDLPAVFTRLDTALTGALAAGNQQVDGQTGGAGSALTGLSAGFVLLTVGLMVAVGLGFRPRIGEYR
ncbi:hypothetical protein Aph02nite_10770 [Actinoplanes philippinensis]|uniref:Secreted protein n=1 Tax=Actinoplanes philippinensis TaxID=35752 RepID=A0A1I2A5U4_9ACTN|nr:hypothetical protein [Actinoplanes philippinensis]GIE75127.1 hypothetical protein Aph02nite_10770 [Actinoplanes philippinensis]SFE38140.1 hypothetical protein SAMN05421541_101468 [Actinoplanes philippinensis]